MLRVICNAVLAIRFLSSWKCWTPLVH